MSTWLGGKVRVQKERVQENPEADSASDCSKKEGGGPACRQTSVHSNELFL